MLKGRGYLGDISRRRWDDNIKIDIEEESIEYVD
jgi:hypothetical protein